MLGLLQRRPEKAEENQRDGIAISDTGSGTVVTDVVFRQVPKRNPKGRFRLGNFIRGLRKRSSLSGNADLEECRQPQKAQAQNQLVQVFPPSAVQETGQQNATPVQPTQARSSLIATSSNATTSNDVQMSGAILPAQDNSLDTERSSSIVTDANPAVLPPANTGIQDILELGLAVHTDREFRIPSDKEVRLFRRTKRELIYCGRAGIRPPPDVQQIYDTEIRERLDIELKLMEPRIRKVIALRKGEEWESNIACDLRMSGRAANGDKTVVLRPHIWISCGSDKACAMIKKNILRFGWVKIPLEIQFSPVFLSSSSEDMDLEIQGLDLDRGVDLGDGVVLYINVEDYSERLSACGLLCCASIRDGSQVVHRLSRIGGRISEAGATPIFISTAHGLLNNRWWLEKVRAPLAMDSERETSELDHTDYDIHSIQGTDEDSSLEDDAFEDESIPIEPIGSFPKGNVTKWRNLTDHGNFDFIGHSLSIDIGIGSTSSQFAATIERSSHQGMDYALIRQAAEQSGIMLELLNMYRLSPNTIKLEGESRVQTVKDYIREEDLVHRVDASLMEEVVDIIFRPEKTARGILLAGYTTLFVQGESFVLRRVETEAPLGIYYDNIFLSILHY